MFFLSLKIADEVLCSYFLTIKGGLTDKYVVTLRCEVRLRLGNKNKNPLASYFILHSPCTNFATAKLGCGI